MKCLREIPGKLLVAVVLSALLLCGCNPAAGGPDSSDRTGSARSDTGAVDPGTDDPGTGDSDNGSPDPQNPGTPGSSGTAGDRPGTPGQSGPGTTPGQSGSGNSPGQPRPGNNPGTVGEGVTFFNVKNYGAKGDGKTDDSAAVKKAVEAAEAANGGIVYLPSGMYLMKSGVRVPMGVSIRGDKPSTKAKWRAVADLGTKSYSYEGAGSAWLNAANYAGTWIVVDHGAGKPESMATFELEGNSGVVGLGFVHKGTAPIINKVTPYPPAVAIKNIKENPYTRDGMTVEDVVLLNAYIGIAAHSGNGTLLDHQVSEDAQLYSLGRMRIHNVSGGPVYRGIVMKGLLDTVDLQNIRFGYTNLEKNYAAARATACADLEWYRADGTNADNIFSFGAKYGILATPSFKNGSVSMRLSNITATGQYPIYITATGQYEIAGGTLTTLNFNNLVTDKDFRALTVIQDKTSVHQPFYTFGNLTLEDKVSGSGAKSRLLHVETAHSTATARVMFMGINFKHRSTDEAMIYYETASASYDGYMSLMNCTFSGPSGGILFQIQKVPKGGLQFLGCTIPQSLINNSANTNNAVWFN